MKLLKYKVNKFRSVKETEWINIDDLACFVGINESGKTNLLLPLWKFNPSDDSIKIDLLLDYPRNEYLGFENNKERYHNEHFIEVLFKLEDQEIKEFNELHKKLSSNKSLIESSNLCEENESKNDFSEFLLIKKTYNEKFDIYISNDKCEELYHCLAEEMFKEISKKIPYFVYYSEYGNLDSDLYLPDVIKSLKDFDNGEKISDKKRMKASTLKTLFNYLGLNPDEILDLGKEDNSQKDENQIDSESRKKQERHAQINAAASRLTKNFRDWWSQGSYIFHFNVDGSYFRIYVSDSLRTEQIELESRSKGLQWFFSFFLVFLVERENNHKHCILLLDEPGLSLHPNAQVDLIKFFDQLSKNNQLIYTTHLPFLVDHNNLDKVKAVYTDETGLTKASNDLTKADKEKKAIQPVNAAIGIAISQSLLVGCNIIIVEGMSDQCYLTMIKNHLVFKGKFHPKKEMVFIPVGGASNVKTVVSIVQGKNSDLPFVLLDSDKTGKQFKISLEKDFYSREKEKILEIDTFSSKTGSEIEDLIPMDLIIENFNLLFRTEEFLERSSIKETIPIIPQLEEFAKNNHLKLETGWKAELSKKVKQKFSSKVTDEIEKKWVKLFEAFQSPEN